MASYLQSVPLIPAGVRINFITSPIAITQVYIVRVGLFHGTDPPQRINCITKFVGEVPTRCIAGTLIMKTQITSFIRFDVYLITNAPVILVPQVMCVTCICLLTSD